VSPARIAIAVLMAGGLVLCDAEPAAAPGRGNAPKFGDGRGGVVLDALAHFDKPTYVGAPDGERRLTFVVEREGVVKLLDGDRKLKGSFLNIKRRVACCEGERGMFSIAFAPNYDRSRRFYVFFTNDQGNLEVDEYRRSRRVRSQADDGSRRKLIEIGHGRFSNHNGGQLQFGPDGLLYAGTGDGGGSGDPGDNAQDKSSLLGKILRVEPRKGGKRPYGIPNGNPYVGEKGANEIYARGLRNPWRFSFDRKRILISDVGEDAREEVDLERVRGGRGANFGWDVFEGTIRHEGGSLSHHDKPIHQYGHSGGNCSITGGYVVRDRRLRSLYGRYLYTDLCGGEIRSFVPRRGGARNDKGLGIERKPGTVSFGVDGRKRVYLVVMDSGRVYRFDPK
jgi:glucose/arabinose dehydrogenase